MHGTSITSITYRGGFMLGKTFIPNLSLWDTVPLNVISVLGTSLPGTSNPLLNAANTSVDLDFGTYYTYAEPTLLGFGSALRVIVDFSDGTALVDTFKVGSFNSTTPWVLITGSPDISISGTGLNADRVSVLDLPFSLHSDGIRDYVTQLTIVPEPATIGLIALGLLAGGLCRSRLRRRVQPVQHGTGCETQDSVTKS